VAAHQALMLAILGAGIVWAAGGVAAIVAYLTRTAAQLLS
jgi:hypothetical protein